MSLVRIALMLSLAGSASAQPRGGLLGAGLEGVTQEFFQKAVADERRGAYEAAASRYALVLSRAPGYPQAVLGRARCLEAVGGLDQAYEAYRQAPMEAEAVRGMGRLLLEFGEPGQAAEQLRLLQTLELGEPEPFLLEAIARLEANQIERCGAALTLYLERAFDELDEGRAGPLVAALAMAFLGVGDDAAARGWYERYLEAWPRGDLAREVESRLDRMQVESEALELPTGTAEPLTARGVATLEGARKLAVNDLAGSLAALTVMAERYPRAPEVHAARAEALESAGRIPDAEVSWLTAVALAPDEPTYRLELGLLLAARYGGRRLTKAVEHLRVARAMRPGWHELHYELGVLYQAMGDFDAAWASLTAYLDGEPSGRFAGQARARLEDLSREAPEPPALDRLLAQRPAGIPARAWKHFSIARVYRGRGDDAAARAEVEQVIALAPEWSAALNLLATLQIGDDDTAAAIVSYEASLRHNPNQPLVRMELGDLAMRAGDEAAAAIHYRDAVQAGASEGWYALAKLAFERGGWVEAREHLERYFSVSSGGLYHADAEALREAVDRKWRLAWSGGLAGLALVVGAPALVIRRRRSGTPLRDFLETHPETYHDVAVVLVAMRHEVLKHNTTVLPSAADALDEGEVGPAREALDRLFGDGVVERFYDYVEELEAIARRSGVRLNLRRRDPVIAPMCAAFEELSSLATSIHPGRDSDRLRALSLALNQVGYQRLGELVRQVCVLSVDEGVLRDCWGRVRGEPGFDGAPVPALEIWVVENEDGEETYPVRIFRRDFEDILGNVLRNSLSAVIAERGADARLGVCLEEEVDWVTGLESVAVRVLDNAPSPLTDAMIRGRYIERGFGLTVDLINRHKGSIQVEPVDEGASGASPGWSKAVVVRLPRAEEGASS